MGAINDLEIGASIPYRVRKDTDEFLFPPAFLVKVDTKESGMGDATFVARYAFWKQLQSLWIAGLYLKPNSASGSIKGTNDNQITLTTYISSSERCARVVAGILNARNPR